LPPGLGEEARGLVRSWRYGLFAQGKSRIVIDASGPVEVDGAFVLPAVDDQPARLVVDLVETTREAFLEAQARASIQGVATETPPARSGRRQLRDDPGSDRLLVVLDPGHGGIDAGATGVS